MTREIPLFLIIAAIYICVILPISLVKKSVEKQKRSTAQKQAPVNAKPANTEVKKARGDVPQWNESRLFGEGASDGEGSSSWEHDHTSYAGSLGAVSTEGFDPCHEEQLQSLSSPAPEPAEAPAAIPGLSLRWTGDEIVRGLVVSEILNRKTR